MKKSKARRSASTSAKSKVSMPAVANVTTVSAKSKASMLATTSQVSDTITGPNKAKADKNCNHNVVSTNSQHQNGAAKKINAVETLTLSKTHDDSNGSKRNFYDQLNGLSATLEKVKKGQGCVIPRSTSMDSYCPNQNGGDVGHHRSSPPFNKLLGVQEVDKVSRYSLNWDDFFGSSLDLAPSLLNIYDGIVASASKDNEECTDEDKNDNSRDIPGDDTSHDNYSSSTFSSPTGGSDISQSQHQRTSSVHLRSSGGGISGKHKLPSQSLPPDRPVSMAEAEDNAPKIWNSVINSQEKQRPLSMTSDCAISTSSTSNSTTPLGRLQRRKRTDTDESDPVVAEENRELFQGQNGRRCNGTCAYAKAARRHEGEKLSPAQAASMVAQRTLVSESRNSVDSGCVLQSADNNGGLGANKDLSTGGDQKTNVENYSSGQGYDQDARCSCPCDFYNDDESTASWDTAGSGSCSLRDEIDSSRSSIREGSEPQFHPSSSSVSSSSSSSASLTPSGSRNFGDRDSMYNGNDPHNPAHRSITGLPSSISEGFLTSHRRQNLNSPSSLPLGHHYRNYYPLDERLAISPDVASRPFNFISPANDSGMVSDNQDFASPLSRLSETSLNSSRTNTTTTTSNNSINSDLNDSTSTVGGNSPDVPSTGSNGRTSGNPAARRSSSFSKSEARKRFFSNYEEHMRQTGQLQQNQIIGTSSSPSLQAVEYKDAMPSQKSSSNDIDKDTTLSTSSKGSPQSHGGHAAQHSPQTSSPHSSSPSQSGQRSSASPLKSPRKRDSTGASSEGGPRGSTNGSGYVSYVQRVVAEILDSERTYIASLKDIIHGYIEPMEKTLGSTEELSCLFGNIRDIYKFGCNFLSDLELTSHDPVKVAECFVKHNKGFVIYTDYCTNYPRAVEVLTRFMQDPELSTLCKERQLALGHGLPLGAYLLRPVQRILKYHLLLQNIVKNCDKDATDGSSYSSGRGGRGSTSSTGSSSSTAGPAATAVLEQAFRHMTEMASHINEMKRKHEHAVRIQEIQSQLEDYVGEDLTRLGDLVLESTFRVYGAKASRQVFLFERGLLISKKKEGGMLSCKTFIKCSNLMLVEVIPNEPLSFHTIPFDNPRAQYTLQARNMEQKRRWCQEVKRLILESYKEKIPDNVKSLVMQLGRNHDDDYVTKEALEAAKKNQHTAPEYLEKRRFRRKSGPRLPDFSLLKPQRAKKGGNKKGDNKVGDIHTKTSPELSRRAESKSPDSQRRFLIRQNVKKRSQSHSLPTTPMSDPPSTELFGKEIQTTEHLKLGQVTSAIVCAPRVDGDLQEKKSISHSDTRENNQPNHSTPEKNGSHDKHFRPKFVPEESVEEYEREQGSGDQQVVENLISKRARSFRKAMESHPITSADLTELMVRCGGGPGLSVVSPSGDSGDSSIGYENAETDSFGSSSPEKSYNGGESVMREMLRSSSDVEEFLNSSLTSKSDVENVGDINGNTDSEGVDAERDEMRRQISEVSRAISYGDFSTNLEDDKPCADSSNAGAKESSAQKKSVKSMSASLPLLNDSDNGSEDEYVELVDDNKMNASSDNVSDMNTENISKNKAHHQNEKPKRHQLEQRACSQSAEDVYSDSNESRGRGSKGRGRMSRRDLQDAASHKPPKHTTNKGIHTGKDGHARPNSASTNIANLHADIKNVLLREKHKALRLPNTQKHLSLQDYGSKPSLNNFDSNGASKAKLTGWNSTEILTKGSVTDLSYLSENPWIKISDANCSATSDTNLGTEQMSHSRNSTGSRANVASNDQAVQLRGVGARPRGFSDVTGNNEKSNKESLDWLVYLNRNSGCKELSRSSSSLHQASSSLLNHPPTSSSSLAHPSSLSGRVSQADQSPNKTNLKQERLRLPSGCQGRKDTDGQVTSLHNTKITITRPVKLQAATHLSRSNSLPMSSNSCYVRPSPSAPKAATRDRPSSVQSFNQVVEEETAQKMIAEMEEYINSLSSPPEESAPSRFPTSLPTILVLEEGNEDAEEDDTKPPGSNRLSAISSLSTSSYESQGSDTEEITGDMVGTLRHKLHSWAKDYEIPDNKSMEDKSDSFKEKEGQGLSSNKKLEGLRRLQKTLSDESLDETDKHHIDQGACDSDVKNTFFTSETDTKASSKSSRDALRKERQLESVLRDHSLGSTFLGSRMAQIFPTNFALSNQALESFKTSDCIPSNRNQESDVNCDKNVTSKSQRLHPPPNRNNRVSTSAHDVSNRSGDCGLASAGLSTNCSPLTSPSDLPARFSLPPSKEATEALVPLALRDGGCDIQQSDSGFSLQSNSSSGDSFSSISDLNQVPNTSETLQSSNTTAKSGKDRSNQLSSEHPNVSTTPCDHTTSQVIAEGTNATETSIDRCDSYGSMDSADSFYERRLSMAFESELCKDTPMSLKVYHDPLSKEITVVATTATTTYVATTASLPSSAMTTTSSAGAHHHMYPLLGEGDSETPLSRRSIREYVQSIEEMYRPQSPKVFEVRRREPGMMIRQRLETLKEQVDSKGAKEQPLRTPANFARSKSQPPSQHRGQSFGRSHTSLASHGHSGHSYVEANGDIRQRCCSDDLDVGDTNGGLSGSRGSLGRLKRSSSTLSWGSREGILSGSKETLKPSRSKDGLYCSRDRVFGSHDSLDKDKRSLSGDLYRSSCSDLKMSPLAVTEKKGDRHIFVYPNLSKNKKLIRDHQFSPMLKTLSHNSDSDPNICNSHTGHEQNAASRLLSSTSSSENPKSPDLHAAVNQFVHKSRSQSSGSEKSLSPHKFHGGHNDADSISSGGARLVTSFSSTQLPLEHQQGQQLSRSMCRLDQLSTEVDNLVIMKGWVRNLISKFQDKPS